MGKDGYGRIRLPGHGPFVAVHRLAAYAWLGEPLHSRRIVSHWDFCGNKRCINPEHLRVFASRAAFRRFQGKARLQGARNPRALLTEEQARRIMSLCKQGRLSDDEIVAELGLGVAPYVVGRIRAKKTWKHLWG